MFYLRVSLIESDQDLQIYTPGCIPIWFTCICWKEILVWRSLKLHRSMFLIYTNTTSKLVANEALKFILPLWTATLCGPFWECQFYVLPPPSKTIKSRHVSRRRLGSWGRGALARDATLTPQMRTHSVAVLHSSLSHLTQSFKRWQCWHQRISQQEIPVASSGIWLYWSFGT